MSKTVAKNKLFDYIKFEKENPNTKMFSWTSMAVKAWHFLTLAYETGESLMPPLHVYMNKHSSTKIDDSTLGKLQIRYTWFNGENPDEYYMIMPTHYECTIYQKNFLKYIRQRFKNIQNVPETSMIIFMTHLLIHEFTHYIDTCTSFKDMYVKKDVSWEDRFKLMKNHMDQLDTFEDEKDTEAAAVEATTHFAYMYWCSILSDIVSYACPVIGGSFDLHLRKSSETWRLIASTLEIIEIERFMTFEECSNEAEVGAKLRQEELIKWLIEYAKVHNTQKWAIVP